jgi:hypothetical protein
MLQLATQIVAMVANGLTESRPLGSIVEVTTHGSRTFLGEGGEERRCSIISTLRSVLIRLTPTLALWARAETPQKFRELTPAVAIVGEVLECSDLAMEFVATLLGEALEVTRDRCP